MNAGQRILLLALAALGYGAAPAGGQSLDARVAAAPDGVVRLHFSSGPGVCGDGAELIGRRDGDGRLSTFWTDLERIRGRDVERECVPGGPVRVALTVRRGQVVAVRTRVGGAEGRGGTDLGRVAPAAAGDFFLRLAAGSAEAPGRDALLPAILSDTDTLWRGLVRLARGARAPGVRDQAAHELGWWASQTVHGRHGGGHAGLKKSTPDPQVENWIRIASGDPDPDRRREAFRLLGRSGDPRAVDFLAAYLDRATRPG